MAEHDPSEGLIAGESRPPDEHTVRVRAQKKAPPTHVRVHDEPPHQPSSSELAEVDRRRRRRERDRRAERRALLFGVGLFVALGGGGLVAVNALIEEPPPPPPPDPEALAKLKAPPAPPPPRQPGVFSTSVNSAPDIPALRYLAAEGLTIAAEGLPQVDALVTTAATPQLAGFETCRFAYGIWEFSPNKRFRFLTTCPSLNDVVMVGAYEVQGAVIRMSPLISDHAAVVSEFHVEKPSKIKSWVTPKGAEGPHLSVNQRVTAIRPGLEGEAFRDTYRSRNTVSVRAPPTPAAPPSATGPAPSAPTKKDPLLELLKGSK